MTSTEERYRKIFEHNNDAVMIVDIESEAFVDVNPAACELLGYSREELLSMHPEDIHPDDVERIREEFITQVHEEGTGFTDDLMCLSKSGETIPVEISGAALDPEEEGGKSTRMIAMLRDISQRVEHRRRLEKKIERLDRFASVVSHDLRNPLSIIKGHTELARETGELERLDAIDEAVDRMDGMLSKLLRLTREGNVIGDRTDVRIGTLSRQIWTDMDTGDATLGITSSRTVSADPERLRELFENLFDNALHHGGSPVTVRVGSIDTADEDGFFVEDTGEGIPIDSRETVFEWGQTTSAEGTGFGLTIVADIVAAHGWQIRVTESEEGGARFEITGM
ncbi:nitrogen regulation protein NR(II) [Salinirubellus sp. GCM10025818]|uniref:two-component system sensor histidine kinase NtrB n=1 Tax=unclassified Salinirubellus TaxID=2627207 RepID=UPI00361896E9